MCDNFEFEDGYDDLLLKTVCTPPEQIFTPAKRLSEASDESDSPKKPKLHELSPPLFHKSPSSNPSTSSYVSQLTISNLVEEIFREPTNTDNSHKNAPYCAKRLFPGPAGICSDANPQLPVCSQSTSTNFQDGPWQEISKDFRISDTLCLHDKFNIEWLKKAAAANQFASQKAPFLAAMLMSLEVSDLQTQTYVNITLKDLTGTIQGNILHSLYGEYKRHFTLGSILILVQFGVLSCNCDKCNNHHVTITPKNLSAIYNGDEKIVIQKIHPQDVLNDFYHKKQELDVNNQSDRNKVSKLGRICNFSATEQRLDDNIGRKPDINMDKSSCTFQKRPLSKVLLESQGSGKKSPNMSESHAPSSELNNKDNSFPHKAGDYGGKKVFTFRKVSDSGNNIRLAGSRMSLRVDNKEDEKLWKDALGDVDIDSFFDDDF